MSRQDRTQLGDGSSSWSCHDRLGTYGTAFCGFYKVFLSELIMYYLVMRAISSFIFESISPMTPAFLFS